MQNTIISLYLTCSGGILGTSTFSASNMMENVTILLLFQCSSSIHGTSSASNTVRNTLVSASAMFQRFAWYLQWLKYDRKQTHWIAFEILWSCLCISSASNMMGSAIYYTVAFGMHWRYSWYLQRIEYNANHNNSTTFAMFWGSNTIKVQSYHLHLQCSGGIHCTSSNSYTMETSKYHCTCNVLEVFMINSAPQIQCKTQ